MKFNAIQPSTQSFVLALIESKKAQLQPGGVGGSPRFSQNRAAVAEWAKFAEQTVDIEFVEFHGVETVGVATGALRIPTDQQQVKASVTIKTPESKLDHRGLVFLSTAVAAMKAGGKIQCRVVTGETKNERNGETIQWVAFNAVQPATAEDCIAFVTANAEKFNPVA